MEHCNKKPLNPDELEAIVGGMEEEEGIKHVHPSTARPGKSCEKGGVASAEDFNPVRVRQASFSCPDYTKAGLQRARLLLKNMLSDK